MALTTGDLAQLKAGYENMSVYDTPTVDNNMSVYNTPTVDNMSIYGDTVAPMEVNVPQQDQETGIAELLLPNTNTLSFNQNDGNNNYVNNNIDYSKLMLPLNKIKNAFTFSNTFSKNPLLAGISTMFSKLPKRDPRQGALENFYGENFGTTSSGSVASGIMQGYNPVSGGLFGGETQYGLGPAINRRKRNIYNSLTNLGKYNYTATMDPLDLDSWKDANKATRDQLQKLRELEKVKEKEALVLKEIEKKKLADERAKTIAADTAAGALKKTVQLDPGGGGGPGAQPTWHGQTAAKERQGKQVSGPGFGQGAYFATGGRIRYGEGGIVTL